MTKEDKGSWMQQSSPKFPTSPATIPSTGFSVISPSLKSNDPSISFNKEDDIKLPSPSSQRNKLKGKSQQPSDKTSSAFGKNGAGFVVHLEEKMLGSSSSSTFLNLNENNSNTINHHHPGQEDNRNNFAAKSVNNKIGSNFSNDYNYNSNNNNHSDSYPSSPSAVSHTDKNALANNLSSIKEQEKFIQEAKKENFSLKLRIYYLEEQLKRRTPESMEEAMKETVELRIKCQTLDVERENIQSLLFDAQMAIEALQLKLNDLLLNEQEWKQERSSLLDKIELLASKLSDLDMLQQEIDSIKKRGVADQENSKALQFKYQSEIDRITDNSEKIESELKKAQNELEEKKRSLSESVEKSGALGRELMETKIQISHLQSTVEDQSIQIQRKTDDAIHWKEEAERRSKELSALRDSIFETSEADNQIWKKKMEDVSRKTSSLESECSKLNDQIASLESENRKAHSELERLRDNKLKMENSIHEMKIQNDRLLSDLDEKQDKLDKNDLEKNRIKKHKDDLESRNRELENAIEDLEKENESKVDSLQKALQEQRKLNSSLERKYNESNREFMESSEKASENIRDLERSLKTSREEYNRAQKEIAALREKEALFLKESSHLRENLLALQDERETFLTDLEKLKKSTDSTDKLIKLSGELVNLKSQLQTTIAERDATVEELKAFEVKSRENGLVTARLKADLEASNSALRETNSNLEMLDKLNKDLQSQVSSFAKEKNDILILLEQHLSLQKIRESPMSSPSKFSRSLRSVISELVEDSNYMTAQFQELKSKLTQFGDRDYLFEQNQRNLGKISDLEEQVKSLRIMEEEFTRTKHEIQGKFLMVPPASKSMDKSSSFEFDESLSFQDQWNVIKKRLDTLEAETNQYKRNVSELTVIIEDRNSEISTLRSKLQSESQKARDSMNDERLKSEKEFDELRNQYNSLQDSYKKLEAEVLSIKRENTNLDETCHEKDRRILELENGLISKESEIKTFKANNESLQLELSSIKDESESLRLKLKNFELQKSDLSKSSNQTIQSLRQKVNELEMVIDEKTTESDIYKKQIESKQSIIDELKNKLTQEIDRLQANLASESNKSTLLERELSELKISRSRETKERDSIINSMKSEMEDTANEKSQIEENYQSALTKIKDLENGKKILIQENADEKEKFRLELREANRRHRDLENEAKIQSEVLGSELERSQKKLALCQEKIQKLEKALSQSTSDTERFMTLASEAEQKCQQTTASFNRLEKEVSLLKQDNASLLESKEKSSSVYDKVNDVEKELEKCKKDLSRKDNELKSALLANDELNSKILGLNSKHREEVNSMKNHAKEMEFSLSIKDADIESLRSQVEDTKNLKEDIIGYQNQLFEAESKLSEVINTSKLLERNLHDKDRENFELKRELENSKRDNQTQVYNHELKYKSEISHMASLKTSLEDEIQSLLSENKQLVEKDNLTARKLKTFSEQLSLYERGFSKVDGTLCKLLNLSTNSRGSHDDVENYTEVLMDSLEKLAKRISAQVGMAENAVEHVRRQLLERLDAQEERYLALKEALNALAKQRNERFEYLDRELRSKTEKLNSAEKVSQQKVTFLEFELKQRDEKISLLERELSDNGQAIVSLEKQLRQIRSSAVSSADREIKAKNDVISKMEEELRIKSERIAMLEKEMRHDTRQLTLELQSWRDREKTWQLKQTEYERQIREKDERLALHQNDRNLKAKASGHQEQNSKGEYNAIIEQYRNLEDKYVMTERAYQNLCEERREKEQILQDQIRSLLKQVELLSLKNQQVEELLSMAKASSQKADPSIDNFKAKADSLYRLNNQLKDQLSIKTRQAEDADNKCRKLEKEYESLAKDFEKYRKMLAKREALISKALGKLESINNRKEAMEAAVALRNEKRSNSAEMK